MTPGWILALVLCTVCCLWVVYAALKAFNGILYELSLTRAYLHSDDEGE